MVPVSFAVLLLKVTGVLSVLAQCFEPMFSLFGLPGESALVFVTAALRTVRPPPGCRLKVGTNDHKRSL
jgi:spore maturation protein SpmB